MRCAQHVCCHTKCEVRCIAILVVQDAMDSLDRSVAAAFAEEQPAAKQTDATSKKARAALGLLTIAV